MKCCAAAVWFSFFCFVMGRERVQLTPPPFLLYLGIFTGARGARIETTWTLHGLSGKIHPLKIPTTLSLGTVALIPYLSKEREARTHPQISLSPKVVRNPSMFFHFHDPSANRDWKTRGDDFQRRHFVFGTSSHITGEGLVPEYVTVAEGPFALRRRVAVEHHGPKHSS